MYAQWHGSFGPRPISALFQRRQSAQEIHPGTGFAVVSIPAPYVTASFPIWALFRQFTFIRTAWVSDILDPEIFIPQSDCHP
jgi:hypothetical protein